MEYNDKRLVTTDTSLYEGLIPTGAVIQIVEPNHNQTKSTVLVKPYIKNKTRIIARFRLSNKFIQNISVPIK